MTITEYESKFGVQNQEGKFAFWFDFVFIGAQIITVDELMIALQYFTNKLNLPIPKIVFFGDYWRLSYHNNGYCQTTIHTSVPKNRNGTMSKDDIEIHDAVLVIEKYLVYCLYGQLDSSPSTPKHYFLLAQICSVLVQQPLSDIVKSMIDNGIILKGGKNLHRRLVKAQSRINTLESAIQLGREEFEQFLTPVLNELEVAKEQLHKLESV